MCCIDGAVHSAPVNLILYDALLMLQHRGQDAAGIATQHERRFFMHKARGMVRDVFRTRNMRALPGNMGLGQVRYPTAGNAYSEEEAQPFYTSAPFGIVLVHNGNLTNAPALKVELFSTDHRHTNTSSDSEVLLGVLAHELERVSRGHTLTQEDVFAAVRGVHQRVRGSYAVIAMIAGHGLLAVFIGASGERSAMQCAQQPRCTPCIFEYVYLARPDSVMNGISVYQARIALGEALARRVVSTVPPTQIDVIIPVPETSRPSAARLAQLLGLPCREGFVKNRYVGRTFIMPGQAVRKKSVRQKLSPIASEFAGKNVLLVDDSIVRGTTSREIVQMVRDAGASKVFLASAAPPVRFPNVYGIDMPTREELVAHGRSTEEICQLIGCDALIYQDVEAMKQAIGQLNAALPGFDASCFDGIYVTGDITEETLARMQQERRAAEAAQAAKQEDADA